jgi:AraC family transcriptional regulator, arabinose operon regulatory protein
MTVESVHSNAANWIIDPHGEQTRLIHPERRQEWQWAIQSDTMGLKLPLIIRHCGNSIWEAGVRIERRKSKIFGIELVTSGSIEFEQNGRQYTVNPGEIFILYQGKDHSYGTGQNSGAHKRFFCLGGEMLSTALSHMGILDCDVFRPSDPFAFIRFFKTASYLFSHRPSDFLKHLSELTYSLLLFTGNEITAPRIHVSLSSAINFMHEHLTSDISLHQVADCTHLSVPHFCHLFKKHTGAAPMEYFRNLKIEFACQQLSGTSARIKEIASRLGYSDMAYFSRLFTKQTGMSPREFKKKNSTFLK